METNLKQHRQTASGFTLIELLVVIAIIAILAELRIGRSKTVSDGQWKVLSAEGPIPERTPEGFDRFPAATIMAPFGAAPWNGNIRIIPAK